MSYSLQMLTEYIIMGPLHYYYWVISNSYLCHHKDWWRAGCRSYSWSQMPRDIILINGKHQIHTWMSESIVLESLIYPQIIETLQKSIYLSIYKCTLKQIWLKSSAYGMINRNTAESMCVLMEYMVCFTPRTIESLYKELVEEGLLIQALKVNLSDYIGKVHKEWCMYVSPWVLRSQQPGNMSHLWFCPNQTWPRVACSRCFLHCLDLNSFRAVN